MVPREKKKLPKNMCFRKSAIKENSHYYFEMINKMISLTETVKGELHMQKQHLEIRANYWE